MTRMGKVVLAVFILSTAATLRFAIPNAANATQGDVVKAILWDGLKNIGVAGSPIATSSNGTVTVGSAIACNSGVSPCTVSTTAVQVLNANTARTGCSITATDIVDLYCRRTLVASPASSTVYDFILNAGSATKKTGTGYQCDSPGNTWRGPVNCVASVVSAVGDLGITETQ